MRLCYMLGALIVLLMVACSVVSAQLDMRFARISAENTSADIGNTTLIFQITEEENYLITDRAIDQVVDTNGTVYSYVIDTMQFAGQNMACFFGLAYFENSPSREDNQKHLLAGFESINGEVLSNAQESCVGGYPAVKWSVMNPMNDQVGVLAQMYIDDQRVAHVLSDSETFDLLNRTFRVGVMIDGKVNSVLGDCY